MGHSRTSLIKSGSSAEYAAAIVTPVTLNKTKQIN